MFSVIIILYIILSFHARMCNWSSRKVKIYEMALTQLIYRTCGKRSISSGLQHSRSDNNNNSLSLSLSSKGRICQKDPKHTKRITRLGFVLRMKNIKKAWLGPSSSPDIFDISRDIIRITAKLAAFSCPLICKVLLWIIVV